MTLRHLLDEFAAFLASDEAHVICVSGKWGVGKTHAWKRALLEASTKKASSLNKYSYVSLFGQNSLDDVRYAVFENTVPISRSQSEADISTLTTTLQDASAGWRKATKLLSFLPQTSDYVAGLSKIGFLSVRDQIICIDDLERAGASLSAKDILGLVSFLKDQRRCKIVILLNDEALNEQNKAEYEGQLEKVADTVFRFEPTPAEVASIGIDVTNNFHEKLSSDSIKLGITNIRVIKKIEGYGRKLSLLLAHYDERVFAQAMHSVTLFAFSKFQPDIAPSRKFIETINTYESFSVAQDPTTDPHAQWRATISEFGFNDVDELDAVLLAGVESGYFEPGKLDTAAKSVEARYKLTDQDKRFSAAWSAYHDSFDDNADVVLDLLEEAVANCAPAISPMNLSSTVTLFRDLGHSDRVPNLIASYIAGRRQERGLWDLEEYAFRDEVIDEEVQAAFDAQHATEMQTRDPIAILIEIGASHSWNSEDVIAAARVSKDELVAALKATRGLALKRLVIGALRFQNIQRADKEMHTLTATATAALRQIGSESLINRLRIKRWKISTDPNDGTAS